VNVRTRLDYAALTYEHVLVDRTKWQLSVPVMLGLGNTRSEYQDSTQRWIGYTKSEVVPTEASVRAAYKLFFWLYVQGGVGYRKVFTGDAISDRAYSGYTWGAGISIKFGKIVRYAEDMIRSRRTEKEPANGSP
jgi:opacity protein-like surface antigen